MSLAHKMFELSSYHMLLAAIGSAIVLAHWLPRWISGHEPAASALLIGFGFLIFGFLPGVPAIFNPIDTPKPWEIVSELCVILGLFGVGLRIDQMLPLRRWRPTIGLLTITMPLTIAALAFAGWAFAGFTIAGALLLGAVLAPTDPVLAGDVQVGPPLEGGEHPVRFALTTEAGLNDGLAFPFVHLALAIGAASIFSTTDLTQWLLIDVAYRIFAGVAVGAAVGWLLGKLIFDLPDRNALAKTESAVTALAGVFMAYGVAELAEGYGFIAAFVSGAVLRRSEKKHAFHAKLHNFSQSLEHSLTAILLLALGAAIPALWPHLTVTGAIIAAALVFVIRPVAGWIVLGSSLPTSRERAVVAFYGIRGIGSIYYLAYAGAYAEWIDEGPLWAIVGSAIVLSTLIHGFSAGFALEHATGEEALGESERSERARL
jgi:sodium/hydrogen antiporter